MPFWTYMLHCADRTFYVGHTDDLEKRAGQHELGLVPGYTQTRRPVKLVWSESFPTRMEAREAERQLKGWGQAKKLALIRGDWALIAALAKGRKEGPSTGSGKPAEGDLQRSGKPAEGDLQRSGKPVSVFLHPHLDHPPSEPFSLEVTVRRAGDRLHLRYRLTGPVTLIQIPPKSPPRRRDELWRRTCFEAFYRSESRSDYAELNFSPSTEWAAYRFDSCREGMAKEEMAAPSIRVESDQYRLELTAAFTTKVEHEELVLNLATVIEEKNGTKSYWALKHPPGPPDFHHPDCFALTLPAPGGA